MENQRRILIVSKNFLNDFDPQAQQTIRIAQNLSHKGMRIDVICGQWERTEELRGWGGATHPVSCGWTPAGTGIWGKVLRKVNKNITGILPVTRWARGCRRMITELMKQRSYDVVISFALPLESHLPVLMAGVRAPWIAYFSDPWPESMMPKPYSSYAMPVLGRLNEVMVRKVLSKCSHAVFPTRSIRDMLSEGVEIGIDRTSVLPHLAHPASGRMMVAKTASRLIIAHVGSVGRDRASRELAKAIRTLPEEDRPILRFIGGGSELQRHFAGEAGVEKYFEFMNWAEPEIIPELIRDCSALLLIEAPMVRSPYLPSKMSDYAYYGLPIIAITPPASAVDEAVVESGAGYTCRNDATQIADAFRWLRNAGSRIDLSSIRRKFSTDTTVERWCEIINRASG